MLPSYLAAIAGGSRLRVARATALYVAGVAAVVLPITLGAAALASLVSDWHPQLFVLGGLMMIAVAVALWRGTMLPVNVPQPRLTGSLASVFGLGAFSGAATACCAPVLVGAIALSATTADAAGGLLLGVAYVLGLVAPLIPLSLAYGRLGRALKGRVAARAFRRAGAAVFAAFGLVFVGLALTGNSETAPGFQQTLGVWARSLGAAVDDVPNVVALPVLTALLAAFAYSIVKRGKESREQA